MDGVLVDSESLHVKLNKLVCEAKGIVVPDEAWHRLTGMKGIDIFAAIVAQFGGTQMPNELVAEKRRLYIEQSRTELEPFPGCVQFLKDAKDVYEKLALTTSGSRYIQEKILLRHDLVRYFDVMVTNDDIERGKPHPEPYTVTTRMLEIMPEDCVVIEDAFNGVLSARAAGCDVVGYLSSFSEEVLCGAGALGCVANYEELRQMLLPER